GSSSRIAVRFRGWQIVPTLIPLARAAAKPARGWSGGPDYSAAYGMRHGQRSPPANARTLRVVLHAAALRFATAKSPRADPRTSRDDRRLRHGAPGGRWCLRDQ